MKKSKLCLVSLLSVLTLVGCGGGDNSSSSVAPSSSEPSSVAPSSESDTSSAIVPLPIEAAPIIDDTDDDSIYDGVFGDYYDLVMEAGKIDDNATRFAAYARAEAELLMTSAIAPTTTQGGSYALTHAAYRSAPYVQWGFDNNRIKTIVLSDDFVSKEEREEMKELWETAFKNNGVYDPAAYLTAKGHSLNSKYNTTFSAIPQTMDIANTSRSADTEVLVQGCDTLMEYDNLGNLKPQVATGYTVSEDGLTYTFKLRSDVKWYKSDKTVYGNVTAADFVNGFHHMLDTKTGIGDLLRGIVDNVSEYLDGTELDFSKVGVSAPDDTTFVIKLAKKVPYFPTMLTYNTFTPLNDTFFQEKGGVYGIAEFKARKSQDTYTYGKAGAVDSILYNGAFICTEMTSGSKMTFVATPNYYDEAHRKISEINYVHNDGSQPSVYYNDVCDGKYVGVGLSTDTLPLAKADGNFDEYAYVTATTATSYFNASNLHRQAYECEAFPNKGAASEQTDAQKQLAHKALLNRNFRKALNYALDKVTWNGVTDGEELAAASLRNMYTSPNFLSIDKAVTYDGVSFDAKTEYGDLVQGYINKYYGGEIQVADGINGWFNPTLAKQYMAQAATDLGLTSGNKVVLDIVNYSNSTSMVAQAQAYKSLIEAVLGDYVTISIRDADIYAYYYSSYYADYGKDCNYDLFYGSGWGPDYGDPITYLNTFLPDGEGYMTKTVGLY